MKKTIGAATKIKPTTLAEFKKTMIELNKIKPRLWSIEFYNQKVYDDCMDSLHDYMTLKGLEIKGRRKC